MRISMATRIMYVALMAMGLQSIIRASSGQRWRRKHGLQSTAVWHRIVGSGVLLCLTTWLCRHRKVGRYHAIIPMTQTRMFNLLSEYDNNIICPKFDTFADINRKYVNNIHLSYVEQLGFAPGTHGISHDLANRESYDHFNECMEYITSLSDNMPHITLEVKEQDYSNPQSSIIQRQNIAEYFNKE